MKQSNKRNMLYQKFHEHGLSQHLILPGWFVLPVITCLCLSWQQG